MNAIKSLFVAGLCICVSATAGLAASKSGPDFRGFKWGSSIQTVQSTDKEAGTATVEEIATGGSEIKYSSNYDEKLATVHYQFDDAGKLVSGRYKFNSATSMDEARQEFHELNAQLAKEYGNPEREIGKNKAFDRVTWKTDGMTVTHEISGSTGGRIKTLRVLEYHKN